jgi:hypothetical protein
MPIRKSGSKYVVKSKSGGRTIGTYKSKGAAKKACQRAAMFGSLSKRQ